MAIISIIIGFILGQITNFIIDPVRELRKSILEAKYTLGFYQVKYHVPRYIDAASYQANNREDLNKGHNEASDQLRKASINLLISSENIVLYPLFYLLRILPHRNKLKLAQTAIMFISNSTLIGSGKDNREIQKECESYLDSYYTNPVTRWIRSRGGVNVDNGESNAQQRNNVDPNFITQLGISVITMGQNAIKSATLINGGAAVAMLAFMGNIWDKRIDPQTGILLADSIKWFAMGVLCASAASGVTYCCQHILISKYNSRGKYFQLFAIFLVIASYILFMWASWCAYNAFLKHF